MDAERTEIGTLGEFGLIAELTKGWNQNRKAPSSVSVTTAVIAPKAGMQTLVSTDLLARASTST